MARRKKKKSKLKYLFLIWIVAVVLGTGYLYQRYLSFSDSAIALVEPEQVLKILPGDSFVVVLNKLRALGVQHGHDLEWKALAKTMGVMPKLQVGDYTVSNGMSPRELLNKLKSGDVIQYRFTIIEGWNIRQLRAALQSDPNLLQLTAQLNDQDLMIKLDRPGVLAEGRFLPETYHFTGGTSDLDILRRALLALEKAVGDAWAQRQADLPIKTAEELLVLASIIEKETGIAEERPQIAGVFVRRLQKGMRLETDPTVIYGMGANYDGNIRRKDLTTDTPYNTYTRFGLPPGPIAMVGQAALTAAANPEPGDSLFFVARGDGSHVFSATYEQHRAAVVEFQLKRRSN